MSTLKIFIVTAKISGKGIINYDSCDKNVNGILEIKNKIKAKSEANAIKTLKRSCKLTNCKVEEIISVEEC